MKEEFDIMMIVVGDKIFVVILIKVIVSGFEVVLMVDFFVGCKVVLFLVLGVFILICLVKYLLGFVE